MHVSDIHCSYDNVQKLKEKIKQEEIKLDVVLISGDVANVPLDQYHTASKELLQEHHDILLRIVTEFVPVAEKVYFIPGNVRGHILTISELACPQRKSFFFLLY